MKPKERAAMQQALEALHNVGNALMCLTTTRNLRPMYVEMRDDAVNGVNEAITAMREALAEQAEQEPVAWRECSFCGVEHQIKSDSYILDTKTDEVFCKKCYVHTHEQPVKQEPVAERKAQVNELIKESARLIASTSDEGDRYLTAVDTLRNAYRLGLKDAAPVRTKDPTEPLIDELRECRDLLMCVESCSRNNFENLAYERVQAIDAVIAADREKNK